MRRLNKKVAAGIGAIAIVGMLVALPATGTDSEHQDISLAELEAKILNDNAAVRRAELAYDLAEEELDEAEDNKGKSGGSSIETGKNRKYYPKEAEMNLYVAGKDLDDTKQSEVLKGTQLYYGYLLLIQEIDNKNGEVLRLQDELAGVEKKIELGTATVNDRTVKELEISNAAYDLMLLQDEKEALFLDMNLALQQDLATVLVIDDVEVPFDQYVDNDIEESLEFVLLTNKGLRQLEDQDELDAILLDIYEDNNRRDAYDSEILQLENSLEQNILDIADKKLSLEYELRSKYNDVLNGYDAVMIKELELENLQLTLNILTKRFEVGFETQNTVLKAQEDVAEGELAILQAKLDYYVAIETYKDFVN